MMKRAIVYIHGKDGSAEEAEHYRSLFPNDRVVGFDYQSQTPWEASDEFPRFFESLGKEFGSVIIIANSIGAFFAMNALRDSQIEKAYFISPVVDMEKLIMDMMTWADVTENELELKKEIPTSFGETLSWEYLMWVRKHPLLWSVPTEILYGANDGLQSLASIRRFINEHPANVTVMENGEHWFHTDAQMRFLDDWIIKKEAEE